MICLRDVIGLTLIISFCHGFPVSPCDMSLESDGTEEIAGTLYEKGGVNCSASRSLKSWEDTSSYVKLYLLHRYPNNSYSEIIYRNLTSFHDSGFDISKPTKILVHGWLEYGFDGFVMDLKNSYFATQGDDVNVVTVDWSETADLLYPLARLFVVPVGDFLADFVDWLVSEAEVSIDSMHAIGLSLGAHVAGVLGEKVTAGKIGRITGLDPAGPMFGHSKSGRLDSFDAKFVDIIHTCGHWAGYFKASGHVDFYPNRGEFNQPGCDLLDFGVCSHKRSYHLFNESIADLGFIARKCDSWSDFNNGKCEGNNSTVMGEHVDPSVRGLFYLHTAGSYPYALGNDTSVNINK